MPQNIQKIRDDGLDILRGIAVFSMIAANMAGSLLREPHPFTLRLYGTFAAPLFIFICSMLVSSAAAQNHRPFSHYLKRFFALLFLAALIDTFVWQIIPFMTIDVLYLIAVSIPVLFFLRKQKAKTFAALTLLFFFIAPLLQKAAGYSPSVHEYSFENHPGLLTLIKQASHHWLVDGWFPLFPWLGFCFLGAFAGKLQLEKSQPDLLKLMKIVGPCLLLFGVVLWTLSPAPLLTREGYSELFYPPTFGYLLTASGVIFTLYGVVQKTAVWRGYDGFKILGRAALFVYLFHLIIIEYVLLPILKQPQPLFQFLGLYFLTAGLAFMAALFLNNIRPKTKNLPYLFRMLTGS